MVDLNLQLQLQFPTDKRKIELSIEDQDKPLSPFLILKTLTLDLMCFYILSVSSPSQMNIQPREEASPVDSLEPHWSDCGWQSRLF